MKKNHKIMIFIVVGVIAVAALVLLAVEKTPPGNTDVHEEAASPHIEGNTVALSERQIASAGIVIETAVPAKLATTLTFPGEIRFNRDHTTAIVPRLDGVAESVLVEPGQQVRKGQILAVLASPAISDLRSEVSATRERLALARTTHEREKLLWENRIAAEKDYLQAREAWRQAEIAARNAEQKLLALETGAAVAGNSNRYELRAPFDGLVVERHLSPGEAVQADTRVMAVSDLSSVWAEIAVSAKDLDVIKVGATATVDAAAFAARAVGNISYVSPVLGEQTRTATARVVLPNPERLWRPGLFANVAVVIGEVAAPITISTEALQALEGRTVVFVRTQDGFAAVPVETGRTDGKRIEIRSGLEAGAQYAAQGSFVLKSELGKAAAEHGH